jgi:hypothetical protein
MRSSPRIAAEGWAAGISARRETTDAAATRAMAIGESVVDSVWGRPHYIGAPSGGRAGAERLLSSRLLKKADDGRAFA